MVSDTSLTAGCLSPGFLLWFLCWQESSGTCNISSLSQKLFLLAVSNNAIMSPVDIRVNIR